MTFTQTTETISGLVPDIGGPILNESHLRAPLLTPHHWRRTGGRGQTSRAAASLIKFWVGCSDNILKDKSQFCLCKVTGVWKIIQDVFHILYLRLNSWFGDGKALGNKAILSSFMRHLKVHLKCNGLQWSNLFCKRPSQPDKFQ